MAFLRRWLLFAALGLLLSSLRAAVAFGQETEASELNVNVKEYIVQPGDTLWNIAEKVAGEATLWPRLWAYNPEVTNPNWLYPGDVLRFYPREEALPHFTELEQAEDNSDDFTDTDVAPEEPEKDFSSSRSKMGRNAFIEVIRTPPPPFKSKFDTPRRLFSGLFVTPKQLKNAGVIQQTEADKLLLATDDQVFIKLKRGNELEVGAKLFSYRLLKKVSHPVKSRNCGYLTQVTGILTVEAVEDNVVRARVHKALDMLEIGQYVAPLTQDFNVVIKPVKATAEIDGFVVAVGNGVTTLAGDHNLVFVDQGSDEGLVVGNRLIVRSRRNLLRATKLRSLHAPIAVLLVVDVQENAATCLVIHARQEIVPGDIVMTPASKK